LSCSGSVLFCSVLFGSVRTIVFSASERQSPPRLSCAVFRIRAIFANRHICLRARCSIALMFCAGPEAFTADKSADGSHAYPMAGMLAFSPVLHGQPVAYSIIRVHDFFSIKRFL